jgi:DNA polymerase-1
VAKALTFGIIYGSTANGIAHNLDIPLSEAERLIALYFVTYPGIEVFISNAHKMAEFNHFVVTVFGFRKMQFGTLPPFRRTAVYKGGLRNSQNVLIQSPTSSAGLFAFGRASEAVKSLGGMATSTVYDSLELEVPIPRVAEAIELIFQCMDDLLVETFDWLDLPIGSDAEIGFNWGKLKSVHRGVTQPEIEAVLFDLKG